MFSEKEIQRYIWQNRLQWKSLIRPAALPPIHVFRDDLSDLTPEKLIYNRLVSKTMDLINSIPNFQLIGCEVSLEKNKEYPIRADLLSIDPDGQQIGLIELKKSSQTERQSFTELLAYANHLSTLFPTLCKEDICFVLIAPMKERIVREAAIHILAFDKKPFIAYIPKFIDSTKIETLYFEPWIPSLEDIVRVTSASFNPKNFYVVKTVWDDIPDWWNPQKHNDPTPEMAHRMNTVSAIAAQRMESVGIHGFAYCSQVWSELAEPLPKTNSLVMVGLNPYAIANDYAQIDIDSVPEEELLALEDQSYCLSDIIPGLKKSKSDFKGDEQYPEIYSLGSQWNSNLMRISINVVDQCLKRTDGKKCIGTTHPMVTWDKYQEILLEDVTCHHFDIYSTGLISDLFSDMVNVDYDLCCKKGLANHPVLGDAELYAVDSLRDHFFFRRFIERMFNEEY